MSFGAEMRDFIQAYQAGSQIRDNRTKLRLAEEEEKNRTAEAKAKAKQTESHFQQTQEGISTRFRENQGLQREKFTYQQGQDATVNARLQEQTDISGGHLKVAEENLDVSKRGARRLELEAADKAWAEKIKLDPQSGYEKSVPIPPPSQRAGAYDAPTEAIPTGPAGAAAPANPRFADLPIDYKMLGKSLDAGLKKLQEEFGLNKGIQDGVALPGGKALMEGEGAFKPETVKQVDAIINSNGLMPEQEVVMKRHAETYRFYMEDYKGPDGMKLAGEAAAQWIQWARGEAALKAHAAKALLDRGDLPGAAKMIEKMHDGIPDGRSTTYNEQDNTFEVTDDQTGEVIHSGEVTPDLIEQVAAAFTKGPEFYRVLMEAAKRVPNFEKVETEAQTKAKKPITSAPLEELAPLNVADYEKDTNEIKTSVMEILGKELADIDGVAPFTDDDEFIAQFGEESADAVVDLGVMIKGYNRGLTSKEAAKLALQISNPDEMAGRVEDQRFDFEILPISDENRKAGIDVLEIMTLDGTHLRLPMKQGSDAIHSANHGFFIAVQEHTQKKVNMTNERVIQGNEQHQIDRLREKGQSEKSDRGGAGMGRRGGAYVPPPPKIFKPPQRTNRAG